ncbi:hypothetical protein CapIbe_009717 [Capra ibex]
MGAEPPPTLQSPELLGPCPLVQQSAARPCASPTMASSGSSSTSSGGHPALPGSPSLLEEIVAAKSIKDIPLSYLGAAVEEGVEAFLEVPLSEDEYQALLNMLPGFPGPQA